MTTLRQLTLKDTFKLKGVAILLLLIHHVFYTNNGLFYDLNIGRFEVLHLLAHYSKLCVAIFVFLSGYGLTVKIMKEGGTISSLRKFYLHRFRKLYQTYWLIWLLFVPLGVLVFHRGFVDVYGDNMYLKLGLDFLGIIDCFNVNGYNLTWWFMSCIILLYLLFPLLYRLLDNNWALAVCLVMALNLVPSYMIVGPIRYYSVTFLLGMACVRYPIYLSHQTKKIWLMLLLFCALSVLRAFTEHHLLIDGGLTMLIVQFYQRFTLPRWLNRLLEFLGHHSMNIFLFHTFIYSYYFRDYVYYFKNPFVIFLLFLTVCVFISMVIERIKLFLIRIGLFI